MSRVLPRPAVVIATEVVPPDARLAGRTIHPWAWWGWALGAGVAVTLASNPLLLVLLVGAVTFVVLQRRTKAPWARSLKLYFAMAGVVIAVRLVFQILIGGLREGTVLFTLPEIALPGWAAGIRLGGPGTIEGLVYTAGDAGRLARLVVTSRNVGDAPELHAKAKQMDPTGARILFAQVEALPMASSNLRARLAAGEACENELPALVRRVIRREGLYRADRGESGNHESETGKGACARPVE